MAGSFVYSLVCGLVSVKKSSKKSKVDDKKRKRSSTWFSHSSHIRAQDKTMSDKSLLLDNSSADDSGYKSPTYDLVSSSADNILDICCFDSSNKEQEQADSSDMLRKSSSLSSLLRCTSIQDKSLRLTRKRRENMAKRRSKLVPTDEGIEITPVSSDVTSTDENGSSEEGTQIQRHPTDQNAQSNFNLACLKDSQSPTKVNRNTSMQMKSWEIRRRRKQILRRRQYRSCDELGALGFSLGYGSLGDLMSVDSKASRQTKVRSFYI